MINIEKIIRFFRRNIISLVGIAIVLCVLSASFGSATIEMLRLLKLKSDLISQIEEKKELSSQLDEDIAQIGTQAYIERIARQYLELYYPNEQIVIPIENTLQGSNTGPKDKVEEDLEEPITDGPSEEYIEEAPIEDYIEDETIYYDDDEYFNVDYIGDEEYY